METRETTKKTIGCLDKVVEDDFIRGWILHFYGKIRIPKENIKDLLEEVVEAPISVRELETDKICQGKIYAGIRDLKQDPNNFEVEPIINYCLSLGEDFHEIEPFDDF